MDTSVIARIRQRPGMFVGDTSDGYGLHHMLWETVGNALDEHLAGRATRITVILDDDGPVVVEDDGAGIPVHLVDGVPFVQLALTTMHETGTLDGHAPHAHVGFHGVGLVAVNALSRAFAVDSSRDGVHHRQRYAEGLPLAPLERVGSTTHHGTRITFTPDGTIFPSTTLDAAHVAARLREIALLTPALTIELRAPGRDERWRFATGLREAFASPAEALVCGGISGDVRVDVALSWTVPKAFGAAMESFANLERTIEHGAHVEGLLDGLADALLPASPSPRPAPAATRAALARGLAAIVHVDLANPSFGNPTKDELRSPDAALAVRTIAAAQLRPLLASRPDLRAALLDRLASAPP